MGFCTSLHGIWVCLLFSLVDFLIIWMFLLIDEVSASVLFDLRIWSSGIESFMHDINRSSSLPASSYSQDLLLSLISSVMKSEMPLPLLPLNPIFFLEVQCSIQISTSSPLFSTLVLDCIPDIAFAPPIKDLPLSAPHHHYAGRNKASCKPAAAAHPTTCC